MTKNFKILSGSTLKLIAVISMFIDHAAHILMNSFDFMGVKIYGNYTVYYVLRLVGRLAFPIFCFLIVEGFLHTRNVKKYCMRLAIFAVISEIPFNLMLSGKLIDLNHQNVYFTLLFGVIALELYKYFDNHLLKFCAVGVMFAIIKVNIVPAVIFIGVVTFSLSIVGIKVGNVFGAKFKSKAEIAGGVILICMGIKILIEHLFLS